jgi:hypothetical protein
MAVRLHRVGAVMSSSPRIGVACPGIGERAAFSDWLRSASIEPVLLVDACLVNTEIAGLRLTAVVADASLLTKEYLADLRKVDGRLPIVAVGDPGDPAERLLTRRGVSFYPRPLDQATFMLAASLAMAEGRPARRSLRRLVPRLPSKIDGASAFLLDVSSEGMRVEVASDAGSRLGPQFHVQVPYSTAGVTVRRVWVRAEGIGDQRRVQCGASLISSDTRSLDAWQQMLSNAPLGVASPAAARTARPAAKVAPDRLLGRVAQMVADVPLVGGLSLPWRSRS